MLCIDALAVQNVRGHVQHLLDALRIDERHKAEATAALRHRISHDHHVAHRSEDPKVLLQLGGGRLPAEAANEQFAGH